MCIRDSVGSECTKVISRELSCGFQNDELDLLGTKVVKFFDNEVTGKSTSFEGYVTSIDRCDVDGSVLYGILYADGDSEDVPLVLVDLDKRAYPVDRQQLEGGIALYKDFHEYVRGGLEPAHVSPRNRHL